MHTNNIIRTVEILSHFYAGVSFDCDTVCNLVKTLNRTNSRCTHSKFISVSSSLALLLSGIRCRHLMLSLNNSKD